MRRVPDHDAAFTLTQVQNLFFAPDWHPGDHPPMLDIVARGRKPDVFTCGVCHRADGSGGREIRVSRDVRQVNDSVSAYN